MLQQTHLAGDRKFEMVPFSQESYYYSSSHCCPNYNNIAVLYNLAQQHNHCFFFLYVPNIALCKTKPFFRLMGQILRCSVEKLSAFFSEVHFCNANDPMVKYGLQRDSTDFN